MENNNYNTIVDKILHELHNSGNVALNMPYSILCQKVTEIQNKETKSKVDAILSANELVEFTGTLKDVYQLSAKGKGIKSFTQYLKRSTKWGKFKAIFENNEQEN